MRKLIGIAEVSRLTGRSRSTIRRYLANRSIGFPQPVQLGPRDRAWYEDEVSDWIDARPRRVAPRELTASTPK